jgi:hypothetical protein
MADQPEPLINFPVHRKYAVLYFSPTEEKDSWISCPTMKEVTRIVYGLRARNIPYRVVRVKQGYYVSQQDLLFMLDRYEKMLEQRKAPQKVCFFQADQLGEIEV